MAEPMSTTKRSLGIFWLVEDVGADGDGAHYHEEVDGFTIHSLWKKKPSEAAMNGIVEQLTALWPNQSVQIRSSPIFAKEYTDLCMDVRILEWPSHESWLPLIEKTLKVFIDEGAVVSWIGSEGSFAWPGLFEPEEMAGTVYAGYAPQTGFIIGSSLHEEMRYLDEADLERLKEVVTGKVTA